VIGGTVVWRTLGASLLCMGVVVGCSAPAGSTSPSTPGPSTPAAISAVPSASSASTPLVTRIPTPATSPSARPTGSADATPRVVDLAAILHIVAADRFAVFGAEPIHLEHVWSPRDLGLGGTCGPSSVPWLECLGVPDWLIQPASDDAGYAGVRLEILYQPGLSERLRPGEGPVNVIGHFVDPASESCLPENRAACRDRFVVTAIEKA
jgi:hypothetical protein